MSHFTPTAQQIEEFHQQGFIVVENLLNAEEIELLRNIAKSDHLLAQQAASRGDGEGGAVKVTVRNELPTDTIYGAIARSRRIVNTMEQVLGDEVYHYHHKMILKEARVGGAWAWHQDYGYWYNNGCLWPDMASCLIAVDPATKANGCLQVVPGSHRLGRIDHGLVGEQTGADAARVAEIVKRLPIKYCELSAGSAIFFHGNVLHRSDQNHSEHPRWAFICCYNTKHNDPYKESRHPRYSPLDIWDDAEVKNIGRQQWAAMQSLANR